MFRDRTDAGRKLGAALAELRSGQPIVIGLPRGGVPVAAEVAQALEAPLDVVVVRKLGLPHQPEFAMGAVGEDGVRLIDWVTVADAGVTASELRFIVEREEDEVLRRAARLRGGRPPPDLDDRVVVVVDDGIATGSTATAAVRVMRDLGARMVVVAAPVAPARVVADLKRIADDVVVLETRDPFYAVGQA
ncbi:MAG TPA: phosphoribosyltransferase family protein, partial [Acidimicrobiia bacterium]